MTSGKLYQSHIDLFPESKDVPEALEKRRASFVLRAGQVFEDENVAKEVGEAIPLQHLFDLWTDINYDNFYEIGLWYSNWRYILEYRDRLAAVFFGTFTIETLNINAKFNTRLKEEIEVVWEYHNDHINRCRQEDIKIFIDRIKLMCEAPLLPNLLKDADDVELRKQAYMHYGDMYGVPESDKALLESYAELYAKVIVLDDIEDIEKLVNKRSTTKELDAMWQDIIGTCNLSRRFHISVFGEESVRPIIPLK